MVAIDKVKRARGRRVTSDMNESVYESNACLLIEYYGTCLVGNEIKIVE